MLNLFRTIFAPPRDLILLLAAGWAGIALSEKRARDVWGSDKALDGLIVGAVVAFAVGGRLLFAVSHLPAFLASPAGIFSLNISAFDPWGGLACAAIAAGISVQRGRLPPWQTLDLLTPFLGCVAIGLSLSHLASGAAFGRETTLPWGIYLWGASRHPTQIYELLAAVLALTVIWFTRLPSRGTTFLLWIALEAASRLLIEGFRGDSSLVLGGFRLAQLISWFVLAAALVGLELLRAKKPLQAATADVPPDVPAAMPPASEPKHKRPAP